MWCGVLGPLELRRADGTIPVIGGSARLLLFGALLSRAGRTVPADVLVEDIWGTAPPRTAAKTLQSHIVRLRHDLGRHEADPILITDRTGYRLELRPDDFDVTQFETAVRHGLAARDGGDLDAALTFFDDALGLWRGEAYEGFADAAFSVAERLRLFELHAEAEEYRTDVALDLGHAARLVPALEKRVAAAPYRERGWEQLIVALYRCGRQADALGAYRRVSATLADDLGIDPGPALRELETRILRQDPQLIAAPPAPVRAATVHAGTCPYLGLASYSDTQSDLFVGRERLTAELVGLLADHHAVVVVGASGTGKSSVLRAGLMAALRHGALPGSAAWRTSVRTPGESLAQIGAFDVVVIDQAEELFTRLSTAERRAAVEQLEHFSSTGGRLVLALRGDYYGRLAELQPLAAYARAASVLVGPLREDELRRVVVEPAQRVGLGVEDALVEQVLDDVAGQPAALPMLSAALVRTWENRDGAMLTLAGYRRGGGVASAVEATAEDAYLTLPSEERAVARRLLVRLAGREGDTWVRRPVRRGDAAPDERAAHVLSTLASARLVSIAQERVELTHDALLVHWPRLRSWLEERVLAAELLDHLAVATRAWTEAGRPASDLYRGARLRAALDWQDEHPDDVSDAERQFLERSAAEVDAELVAARERAQREARGRRRLRAVAIGLAAMVVLAAVGVGVALHERGSANRSAQAARAAALSADARRLAALSVTAPDIATSSLLAVAAYRLQDSAESRGALLGAVERDSSALWRIEFPHRLLRVVATPDGSRVFALDNRRDVYVVDPRTRRRLAVVPSGADLISAVTPDGRQLITYGGTGEEPPIGHLAVLDVATGRRHVLLTDGEMNPEVEPALSAGGRWLVQVTDRPVSGRVAVDVFDAHDWSAPPRRFAVPPHVEAIAASRSTVAVEQADGSVTVYDLSDLRPVARVARTLPAAGPEPALAISTDGSRIAVMNNHDARRAEIVRVGAGGGPGVTVLPTQTQDIGNFAFSPGGAELAVTTLGGAVTVYRSTDGAQVEALAGQAGPTIGVAWTGTATPTGLYTDGLDSDLVSWSVSSRPRLVTLSGPDVASPDRGETFGRYVLGITPGQGQVPESRVKIFRADLGTGRWAQWSVGLRDGEYVNQASATGDGSHGLLSIQDQAGHNRIEMWDLVHRVRIGRLALPPDVPNTFPLGFNAAISPDGRRAYCNLGGSRIGVFALPSGRYLKSFDVHFAGRDGARVLAVPWRFDPAGRLLFGGYDTGPHPQGGAFALGPNDNRRPDHRLALVNPRTGRLLAQAAVGDVTGETVAEWSHDRRYLALGTNDGTLTLFDAATLAVVANAGAVEPGFLRTAAFSPDDRTIVTSGTGGSISFWAVPTLQRVAAPLPLGVGANAGGVYAWYAPSGEVVGFAPDGARPGSSDRRWFRLRARPAELTRTACALAGGAMTRRDWARYVGDQPYRRIC